MKYEAVLYDLDGTLIDSVPFIVNCFRLAYERVLGDCSRSDEDFKSYIGKPLIQTFEMHDDKTARELFDAYIDINETFLRQDKVDIFPGVKEDIKYFHDAGIKQGIVTSKRRDAAMITINHKNLDKYMDVYVFMEDSLKHKPDAEPLLVAAHKLGIDDLSKIIYVGDALPDALCAKNAGTDFALVNWTNMSREEILRSTNTHVITTLKEISCIIDMTAL